MKRESLSLETQIFIMVLILVALLGLMIWPGWQWAFMGLVCASICNPWVKKIRALLKSDRTTSVIILLSFLFIISIIPLVVLILSVDIDALGDFGDVKSIVQTVREGFERFLLSLTATIRDFVPGVNHAQLKTTATDLLKSLSGLAGQGVTGMLGAGPELATNLFIFLITFYYALVSFRKFRAGILRVPVLDVPFKAKLLRSFSLNAYSSVVAAGSTAAVQALILSLGMVSLGYQHWALGTMIAFFAAFIPVVGTLPVSAIVIIQFAIQGETTAAIIFLVVAVVAGISDNFIRPMFLKGAADMHPWLAFVSVLGGLSVFGIWGLFIGPIIVGLLLTTWSEWVALKKHRPRPQVERD
ncbi:MAG TPA: AI-2E family transporter [Bdellovibrionota bacterium]|jgi:predicted PurR-regulated permease PerM|nr:AI-2E family transporter [Bdellovibrionota bacterium]